MTDALIEAGQGLFLSVEGMPDRDSARALLRELESCSKH